MLEIRFEDGLQEINLNGKVAVWLNLSDVNFIERFFNAFEAMDLMREKYKATLDSCQDNKLLFETAHVMDSEMRTLIDGAFGTPICEPLFGSMSTYAIAGGLPIWCNLMLAVIEEMSDNIAAEKKATNPKLQKYIAKYKRN